MIPRRLRRGAPLAAVLMAALLSAVLLGSWRGSRTAGPTTPAEDPARAAALDSLESRGLLLQALELARRDVDVLERTNDARAIVAARLRLARLCIQHGESRMALGVLARARPLVGDDRLSLADVLYEMGRAEKSATLYAASEAHYDSALRLARTAGARTLEARILVSIANLIRRDAAERPRAVRLCEEATGILTTEPDVEPGVLASAYNNFALILLQVGEPARAESLLSRSVPITLGSLSPGHPGVGLAHSLWGWSQYLLGRHAAAEKSFRAAIATYDRARTQFEGTGRRAVAHRVSVNLAGALLAQDRGEEAWAALETGLSSYIVERLAPAVPAGTRSMTGSVSGLRQEVQKALDDRTAIVGWVEVNLVNEPPRDVWGYVIRRNGPVQWVRLPAPKSARSAAAELAVVLARDAGWPVRVLTHTEATEVGRRAWSERVAPLMPHLRDAERLILIQGWNGREFLEAFIDDGGQTLLDRFEVTYAPSASAYGALRDRAVRPAGTTGALLVGDAGGATATLTEPDAELRRIAGVLPEATILFGERARGIDALGRRGVLERYEYLHFATHAATDPKFAGGGALLLSVGAAGDSILPITAEAVEKWKLRARLVTLNGCQTSGVQSFGTSQGLAESFLVAGAAGVIVSGWTADDRAAALLMARFYENLAGGRGARIPAALREAKLWLRDRTDEHGRHPFRNPAYWAGFLFIGGYEESNPQL